MSQLTQRAEQALLGAVLADGLGAASSQDALDYLEADYFGHRAHRQVFAALRELRDENPNLVGDTLLSAVADRLDAPGAGTEWLTRLRDAAGPAEHVAEYTQMIQTGALRRDIAVHARRIASGLTRSLGDTLLSNARIHARLTGGDPDTAIPTPPVEARRSPPDRGQDTADPLEALPPGWRPEMRARYEELLLSDLLQNPEQAIELARVLPDGTFTSDQRREVYRTIVTIAADGDPIDEVIVAWQLEQQRALAALYDGESPGERPTPEMDIAFLDRLTVNAPVLLAAEIAQFLISEDVRVQLAGTNPPSHDRPVIGPPPATAVPDRPPMPLDPGLHRPQPPETPTPNPRNRP